MKRHTTIQFASAIILATAFSASAQMAAKPATKGQSEVNTQTHSVDRPDAWIKTKVVSKLAMSKEVGGEHISVEVSDGNVSLRGTVKTEMDIKTATDLASSTVGVKSVDASGLVVEARKQESEMAT